MKYTGVITKTLRREVEIEADSREDVMSQLSGIALAMDDRFETNFDVKLRKEN